MSSLFPSGVVSRIDGRFAVLVVLLILAAAPIEAQTGSISGRITDQQEAALVGATIAASSPVLPVPVVVVSDAAGEYRLDSLGPGRYTVTVSLPGFSFQRHPDIDVRSGESITLDVQLTLAPFAQQVDVVGVAPALGAGVSSERVPATVSVLDSTQLESSFSASIAGALHTRLGAVTLEDTTANPFQPTLRFRGFTASPLLGLPQGIAVYQNGVRINEPFGDTVQFDLIPQFAIDRAQLTGGAEPTYGLNALGGSLALRLKNGFEHAGFRAEVSGGSFERVNGVAEWGANRGPWAVYLGASHFDEEGWRVASPSEVTQAVADLGYREGRVDAGVTFTYADTRLNGNSAAPIELLEFDRSAVFTYPDITENQLAFVQGRLNTALSSTWSLQVNGYYRDLNRDTLNGDEAEFSVCDDDSLPPGAPGNTLCHGAGDDDDDDGEESASLGMRRSGLDEDDQIDSDATLGDDTDEDEAQPLVDVVTGRFITVDDAEGDAAFNRTTTSSNGYGATLQATGAMTLDGRENLLIVGVSADLADVAFGSNSEIGTLTPDRTVTGAGLFTGIFGQAPDDIFNTEIDTENRAFGLYFSDTLSLTDRFHLTASGRFNDVHVDIVDRLGTSLNGEHRFSRFNPGVGVVVQLADAVSVFGRYSAEEPCRVPNAFVSDPPLEQAVARSVEGGARGRWSVGGRSLEWSVAVYRTGIRDDILFVASPQLIGTGFFQNAGDTRRAGMDAEASGQVDRFGWFASYGLVNATFESPLELPSNPRINDAANADGNIEVQAGDRLPGIPRHSFKGGVGYAIVPAWDVAVDLVAASSRVFVGDEGNDQPEVDGYGVVNFRTSYRVSPNVELFGRVDNLFDREYETFGALAELEVPIQEVPDAEDPRFLSPGAPLSGFVGLRVRF
jgi:outer membrane receptor protein involved in Fe transport